MKKYIHYIWCALSIGLLTGCMLEEERIETGDDNLVQMTFNAVVEGGDMVTKTILDENEVAGVRSVLWEPEDVIGVAVYNGRYQRFENVLEEPAASGVFSGSVNQDIMYYAVYPYRENQQMSTSVAVNIPAKQNYKPDSFDGSAAPMFGKGNHAEPLYFMNLCGSLAVQLTGSETIKSILFQATSGEKVSGDGTVDADYADYPVLTMSETADSYAILDCGEGVQLSATPTNFHFVLPPGTYNGFKLIISTTDGQFMEKSTDKQLKIKRSIVTKAASLAFENTATNFTDLSERGTANSYIVTQAGYYSFDATVIGNGEFGFPANNNYHTNTPEIAPASAELLWADNHKLINGCGYDASTGMLKFLTSGDEGNAVIAAKDSEGNILWSWHIWMTDQPEEQVYNNNAGILMDRNLGATSATPGDVGALGLLYQWGRKDPFLGAVSIDSSTQRESTITWPSPVSSDATNGTIGYSVLNPTVFIKYNGSNYDWYYTGDSSTDDSRWQSAKTVYDPCPSGWRVPDGGSEGVWALAGFTNTAFDDVNKGRSFEITSPEATWYPALGYLDRSNGALYSVGIDGHYWSVSPTGRSAFDLYFYGSSFNMTNSDDRAYGFAVRCTKDEGYVDISYPQVRINAIEDITTSSAKLVGNVKSEGVSPVTERGFIYGQNPDLSDGTKVQCGEGGGEFSYDLSGLTNATRYYVKAYAVNSRGETQTPITSFATKYSDDVIHLSSVETANCYIVRYPGEYTFDCTVKGNSQESVGSPVSVEVLWETDNTSGEISVGDIIADVSLENNAVVLFSATGKEGNAVIAVKDASDEILWSWHIWVSDFNQDNTEQMYPTGAIMMDRNLGALSVEYGNVLSWGLFYQQGRKDPFVGCGDITARTFAATAPANKIYYQSGGDDDIARKNPNVTLGSYSSMWTEEKNMNDPCPPGWKVPPTSVFQFSSDDLTEVSYGRVFPSLSGADIYFPLTGDTQEGQQYLRNPGTSAYLWTSDSGYPYNIVYLSRESRSKYDENPVRCMKEGLYDNGFSTSDAYDLSSAGTANSYIVSSAGIYSFSAVKGNSAESVCDVSSVEVLWESFGTNEKPVKGSLISGTKCENGRIYLETAPTYKEGNAVIAAKDSFGDILWSWHIWLTDQPEEQIYPNDAGTMMDRNLGATSATPGDVGALGLLYQWGRKDPFLSSSSISSDVVAKSTLTWPSEVWSNTANGTIEYSIANPTTFIIYNSTNYDWYYNTGPGRTDYTRWQSDKTKYDPCPVGWQVPDGGNDGIWKTAGFSDTTYDSINQGISFVIGNVSSAWYPASGYRAYTSGTLVNVGFSGNYWSVRTYPQYHSNASTLTFGNSGSVNPSYDSRMADGQFVRCFKEGTEGGIKYDNDFSTSAATSLSDTGTANSYIVSSAGTYSIIAVKGNSSESVGTVASAKVLWESLGTDIKPSKGALLAGAKYENGRIYFKTADIYSEGNAVIAAKDVSGKVLWSWHIWLTDQPGEHVYNHNAGTMMDRNLGAISATPGDVGALGLLYQWGRKDPFLGSSSISSEIEAKSTIAWPSVVPSDSFNGTIDYAIEHPTTFISSQTDWYYTDSDIIDSTRWQSQKTIYDPCPVGWRVPDGDVSGVWNVAGFSYTPYDDTNFGISFIISSPSSTWYPSAGSRHFGDGGLGSVGSWGYFWSANQHSSGYPFCMNMQYTGGVYTVNNLQAASAFSVRCLRETD